jgi:23S rRNA (cytidine1920-2'-O)/16S rRNA (cytidine1409-2'-O)-methyltransferase
MVCERRNGLHFPPPEPVDLVVADMGWTPQRLLIPAALKWLKEDGTFISLIKPHYELKDGKKDLPRGGVLSESDAEAITQDVLKQMPSWGAEVLGVTRSPILGGEHKGKGTGNAEWLAWGRAMRSGT